MRRNLPAVQELQESFRPAEARGAPLRDLRELQADGTGEAKARKASAR